VSAVPPRGRSTPIVDASSGKSCKVLPAGHELPRPAMPDGRAYPTAHIMPPKKRSRDELGADRLNEQT